MINPVFIICMIIGVVPWNILINPKEPGRKMGLLVFQFIGVVGLIINLIIHS